MTSLSFYISFLCSVFVAGVWAEIQNAVDLNSASVDPIEKTPLLRQYTCGSTAPVYVGPGYQGRFGSPNYPASYNGGSDCIWIMTTSADAKFTLKCDPFYVPCQTDYMIYSPSGDTTFQDASQSLCGTGKFEANSTTNAIAIYFHSSYFTLGGAFSCVAQAISTRPPTTARPTTTYPPIIPYSCDCGIKGSNRIVGGEAAGVSEWPWQTVLADISPTGGGDQYCGATLIAPSWVMTAAHCTQGRMASNLAIVVGQYDRNKLSANAQVRKVLQIIQHPWFNRTTVDHDIALLRLESPVSYNFAVRPACLPTRFANYDFDYQTGVITGWGSTSFGGVPTDVLYEVAVPILSTSRCRQNPNVGGKITENMFCTYADKKDACQGDSGGPLNWVDPYSGRVVVIGITSWGMGCAKENTPGVYTKVTNYLSWIQQYTGSLCSV